MLKPEQIPSGEPLTGSRDQITRLLWQVQQQRPDLVPAAPLVLPDGQWSVTLIARGPASAQPAAAVPRPDPAKPLLVRQWRPVTASTAALLAMCGGVGYAFADEIWAAFVFALKAVAIIALTVIAVRVYVAVRRGSGPHCPGAWHK